MEPGEQLILHYACGCSVEHLHTWRCRWHRARIARAQTLFHFLSRAEMREARG